MSTLPLFICSKARAEFPQPRHGRGTRGRLLEEVVRGLRRRSVDRTVIHMPEQRQIRPVGLAALLQDVLGERARVVRAGVVLKVAGRG